MDTYLKSTFKLFCWQFSPDVASLTNFLSSLIFIWGGCRDLLMVICRLDSGLISLLTPSREPCVPENCSHYPAIMWRESINIFGTLAPEWSQANDERLSELGITMIRLVFQSNAEVTGDTGRKKLIGITENFSPSPVGPIYASCELKLGSQKLLTSI